MARSKDSLCDYSGETPILHHLNVDSSWLLQIPRPKLESGGSGASRKFFNVLIDPWLAGSQTDVGIWLSKQWFRKGDESVYPDIPSVERLIARTEGLDQSAVEENARSPKSLIDAVFVCHEFTDHCHHDTLIQLPPSVPIFANANPAKLIRSWHHFYNVHTIEPLGDLPPEKPSIHAVKVQTGTLQTPHLPPGFAINYISGGYNGRNIGLPFHVALVFAFPMANTNTADASQQVVIYTPHGVPPASLTPLTSLKPQPRTLCLLHGKNEFWLAGAPVNLGARNAFDVVEVLKPKYWIGTHEPVKEGVGIVQTFLRRTEIDLEEVKKERRDSHIGGAAVQDDKVTSATFQEIANGGMIELV